MGIEVVAEGVEFHEEFEELKKLGCDLGQGDYWWDPHLPRKTEVLLASNHPLVPPPASLTLERNKECSTSR